MENDTIAAISTAVADSGISIIRISGEQATFVIDRIYRPRDGKKKISGQPSHTIHYGFIQDGDEVIDEVLVSLMRAPRSYTAEDVVEIHCHGGIYATRRVLDAVIKNGARPAEPGEFTKRAFLNGRIDLSRAEAVIDIINAKNEFALKSSVNQLKGAVHEKIKMLRETILGQLAFIEASLDDPEHISLDGYSDSLKKETEQLTDQIRRMIDSADDGRILKEGIQTVILGKPNVGKSSLLNALLREERAIVTEIAGTTRDVLEETLSMNGIMLNLIDTAGIRNTEDIVEKIGVEKAKEKAEQADLVIYVVDSSTELDENDREIMRVLSSKKVIVLLNKSDLSQVTTNEMVREFIGDSSPVLTVSAKENTGLDALEKQIREMFYSGEISFNDEVYITNARQKAALTEAKNSLEKVLASIENHMPEDFYSIDLMDAYASLGRIIGESVGEDLINEIFANFCMGK